MNTGNTFHHEQTTTTTTNRNWQFRTAIRQSRWGQKRVKSRAKVPARTITTTTETTVTTTQPLRHVPSLSVSLTHTPMSGIILEHCWRAQRLLVFPSFLLSNTNWYTHKHNFYYKKKVNKKRIKELPKSMHSVCVCVCLCAGTVKFRWKRANVVVQK